MPDSERPGMAGAEDKAAKMPAGKQQLLWTGESKVRLAINLNYDGMSYIVDRRSQHWHSAVTEPALVKHRNWITLGWWLFLFHELHLKRLESSVLKSTV